ncbi:MAG: PAS domain S-box protein [Acidobacteriia bacterium]|nr:PAS domain S-box protein [Terriglobia bacterium]
MLGLATLLVALISGFLLTRVLVTRAENDATRSLTARIVTAAASRTWDRVGTLQGLASDQGKPVFEEVRKDLRRLQEANADARFVYLAALRGGQVVFLADAEPADSEGHAPPGKVYDDAGPGFRRVFTSGQAVVEGPYKDHRGVWVSGLAPVRDARTGAVVAVLGLDIDANRWASGLAVYRWLGVLLTALAVVATLVIFVCAVHTTRANALFLSEIDERRRAAEAVRAAESRWREFVSGAPIGIIRATVEGHIIEANPALLKLSGFAILEQMNECGLVNLWESPQDRERLREIVFNGPVTGFETQLKRADGSTFTASIHVWLVRDEQGQPRFVEGTVEDVTERRRAAEAVRAAESRWREFVAGAPIGVIRTTVEGCITEANPALLKLSGFESLEQLNEFGLVNLYESPEDRQRLLEAVLDGPVTGFETQFKRAGGRTFTASIHARLVRDEQGRPRFVEGTIEDVTERRRAEEAQKASEQRLSSIISFLPDATFVVDNEGKVIAWNQAMEALTGVKATDILGKGDHEYALPFYGERRPILIDYALSRDTRVGDAYLNMRIDDRGVSGEAPLSLQGNQVYLAAKAAALFDHTGKISGAIEIIRDITDRKKAEEALLASEERYRTLISNLPVGLYRNTPWPEGRLITANPAIARMFGYASAEEFMKVRSGDTWVDPAGRKAFSDRLLAQDQVAGVEVHLKKRDGTPFWGSITTKVVRNSRGEVEYFDGMIEDISERKHAEEELKLRNVLLSTQQEVSLDGILVVDMNGKMISFNQRFVEMWGIPNEVVESRSDERALQSVLVMLVSPEEFIAKVNYLYDNLIETSRDEIALVDGRTFDRYSAPMLGSDGIYYGRVWYFRDITQNKQAEEELRKAKVTAEEASRAKGNFLATRERHQPKRSPPARADKRYIGDVEDRSRAHLAKSKPL